MKKPTPQVMETGALDAALPEINAEIGKMQQNVVVLAFNAIREGKLTPDLAKDLWHQMASMAELNRRLNTRSSLAGADAQKRMDALTAKKD